eukprot:TRINITY_DN2388_c0_g2_i1.p1 TRINITY_DN2388_c0_g2~~TRINITY_DN2388_c0_g2_i1.p1  ORF type:complete len:486 (-),score=103.11 TRINITY_DN2388_c0_g2_i1:39-1496(-)
MYIFGGWGGFNKFLNDIHIFHLDTCTWSQPITTGESIARAGHTISVVANLLVVIGGANGSHYFDQVQVLDLETMIWSTAETTGTPPSGRSQHTANVFNEKIYVFGGGKNDKLYNDLYILDIETLTWSRPRVKGIKPEPRWGHSATTSSKNKIYVFGGNNGMTRENDLYILDVENLSWKRVEYNVPRDNEAARRWPIEPFPRAGHTCCYVGGSKLVVFGGGDGHLLGDMCCFNMNNLNWNNIESANAPSRCSHSMETYGSKLIVFGGSNGIRCYNDLYFIPLGRIRRRNSQGPIKTSLRSKLNFNATLRNQKLVDHVGNMANRTLINNHFHQNPHEYVHMENEIPRANPEYNLVHTHRMNINSEFMNSTNNTSYQRPQEFKYIAENPKITDLKNILYELDMTHYLQVFVREEIYIPVFPYLKEKHLEFLGMGIRDRIIFINKVKSMFGEQTNFTETKNIEELTTIINEATEHLVTATRDLKERNSV